MKNLILVGILLFSVITFGQKRHAGTTASAQSETTTDTTATPKAKWSKYVAVGLSISSGNNYGDNTNKTTFDEATYPSIEFGFSRENLSLGLVLGRGNLRGLGNHNYSTGNYEQLADKSGPDLSKPIYGDKISNYYWEVKATPTFPLGVVNASIIFGVGSYFSNEIGNTFIEYGSGISYTVNKFTYGVCYTNWDGIDYITPNVSYGF